MHTYLLRSYDILQWAMIYFTYMSNYKIPFFYLLCKRLIDHVIQLASKHKPVNNPFLSKFDISYPFLKTALTWPLFQECLVLKKKYMTCL